MTAPDESTVLPLSEVFGPTFQGEGPHAGRRCFFVRLGKCNLHCSWCDTPYTWDETRFDVDQECPDTAVRDIHARLRLLGARLGDVVVLSGGEPLIHHHSLPALLGGDHLAMAWHLETNGTIVPPLWLSSLVEHVTLSPKVGQNDDPERRRLPARSLHAWSDWSRRHPTQVAWKFVCRSVADVLAVRMLVREYDVDPSFVWIMAEGVTPTAILEGQRALAPAVQDGGFNLTTRLHTLLWGEERGR